MRLTRACGQHASSAGAGVLDLELSKWALDPSTDCRDRRTLGEYIQQRCHGVPRLMDANPRGLASAGA